MTNFRHSQNPRMARKRPSRTSRTAVRRKAFDNRYREWSEIHDDYKLVDENGTRLVMFNGESGGTVLGPWIGPDGNRSARRNRRANHKRARDPREIGLTSFEPMPYGYERWNGSVWLDSWVDQYNSELERIETRFNDGYDVTHLVNGLYNLADTFDYNAKTSRRANRRRPHTSRRANRRVATRVPDWAIDNNGNKLVIGEWYKTPSDLYPQDFQFLENGTRDWSGDWDSWESLREFLEHPKSPGVIPSDWGSHTSRRARRQPGRMANRRPSRLANHRARRKTAQGYNGWANWDTWEAYNVITADESDYRKGTQATHSGNPLDLISVFQGATYHNSDVDIDMVDWDEVYLALDEEN